MRPEPYGHPDQAPVQPPLRVALVSMHTSPADRPGKGDAGGMNVVVLESAMALAARGNLVDIFTRAAGAPRTESLAPGVTLYALEAGGGVVRKHELPNLADAFGQQLERAAWAADQPYDVLHAHYWLSGLAALPVSLSLGMPIVQTFHTLAHEKNRRIGDADRAEPERRLLTERYLAGEVDAIAAVSRAEVDMLCDGLGAAPGRVWLVPPAVDTLLFHPEPLATRADVRTRLGVRPDDGLIACVGRVQPLKGQDLAVRMLQHLPGAVLVLAGDATPGDERYLESLHDLARDLGVEGRVRHIGSVDREALAQLLDAADVVVVPSRTETFGLVPLEAAASGTPVVASRVGGLTESVLDGETGILVDGRDPMDWADAVGSILEDVDLQVSLGLAGRRAATRRDWQDVAHELETVYRATIAARATP
ncbi:glycosyltransferase [Agrococcus carbonis]|uniref:D-inositol 3-phosphate glycosyltransferase n=1 Tax=Agrococcus carbonis TaxID=684552 RepID=A0A1H1S1H4_9MICO|nr:glycosyltransferase [Agrococcus carbonis]SDS41753.1 D-inositol-3-phosphate glycosyltransferase [Agrococcus carbonis]